MVRDTGTSPLHPARAEFALAVALRLARDATGIEVTPIQVCFAHPRTRRRHGTPALLPGTGPFRERREHDDPQPCRCRSAAARRRPGACRPSSAGGSKRLWPSAISMASVPMSGRVRRILMDDLGQTALAPAAVARALDVSTRTLSRRLAAEGTSFRHILDQARCELAMALLHDGSLSVGDIAFFLQYSEPAAFHRSFRRWTGQTPNGGSRRVAVRRRRGRVRGSKFGVQVRVGQDGTRTPTPRSLDPRLGPTLLTVVPSAPRWGPSSRRGSRARAR